MDHVKYENTFQVYTYQSAVALQAFLCKITDSAIISDNYTLEMSLLDLVSQVATELMTVDDRAEVRAIGAGDYIICNQTVMAMVSTRVDDPLRAGRTAFSVTVAGERLKTIDTVRRFRSTFGANRLAVVKWCYIEGTAVAEARVVLEPPSPLRPEFYPWIDGGPESYFDDYLSSDASVLFLIGPPGTGKTSLLRWFIYKNHLNAVITYDEKLLATDGMFAKFMTSQADNVLVVEDADMMLSSREHDANRVMNRFLNVSDGLVKFRRKKIIFTTNLPDVKDVDSALTRPGRCFGVLKARELGSREAETAARAAGIPFDGRPCTLAQLFNPDSAATVAPKRVVGF